MKRFLVLFLVVSLAACTKQSLQTTYDKQAGYIESFLTTQLTKDTTATLFINDGAYRLNLHDTLTVFEQGTDSLQWGGKVSLYYGCFILSSSSLSTSDLVATNFKDLADDAGWVLSDESHFKLDTITLDKTLVPGLAAGLVGVQPEDEGYILFTGKYGYGASEKGTIPARSALAYYFWIENISNEN